MPHETTAAAFKRPRQRATDEARAEASERRQVEQDLRQAVSQESLTLHYQPRVNLRSGTSMGTPMGTPMGTITGAEALIRWPHRRRGMIAPAFFIPLAEQSGLITRIGAFVLRAACAEAMLWPDPGLIISVNVSARQLSEQVLLGQVAAALEISGLPAERLELELSESMLLHVDTDTLLCLAVLRDLGIGLALDDFGTGYASLGMLKRLPLTVMKLDRSLVRDLPDDREDVAIARAAVQTGQALGLRVVAEGIETAPQRDFLAAIGCDEGQGHLFARPLPPAQLRPRFVA